MLLSQDPKNINTYIMNLLLLHGPMMESSIISKGRPKGFRHLTDKAYQVRINRALHKMSEIYQVIFVIEKRQTHGGLGNVYVLGELGLLTMLSSHSEASFKKNVEVLVKHLKVLADNNKLPPVGIFGIMKAISEPSDIEFIEYVFQKFFESKKNNLVYQNEDFNGFAVILEQWFEETKKQDTIFGKNYQITLTDYWFVEWLSVWQPSKVARLLNILHNLKDEPYFHAVTMSLIRLFEHRFSQLDRLNVHINHCFTIAGGTKELSLIERLSSTSRVDKEEELFRMPNFFRARFIGKPSA